MADVGSVSSAPACVCYGLNPQRRIQSGYWHGDTCPKFIPAWEPVAKGHSLEPVEDEDVYVRKGDQVNHPDHYTQGEIECIDAIRSALTPEGFRGYCMGNAMKYLWRERHKGKDEDVRKAEWYLRELLK